MKSWIFTDGFKCPHWSYTADRSLSAEHSCSNSIGEQRRRVHIQHQRYITALKINGLAYLCVALMCKYINQTSLGILGTVNIKDWSSALARAGLLKTATSVCVWSPSGWAAAISKSALLQLQAVCMCWSILPTNLHIFSVCFLTLTATPYQ